MGSVFGKVVNKCPTAHTWSYTPGKGTTVLKNGKQVEVKPDMQKLLDEKFAKKFGDPQRTYRGNLPFFGTVNNYFTKRSVVAAVSLGTLIGFGTLAAFQSLPAPNLFPTEAFQQRQVESEDSCADMKEKSQK